MTCMIQLKNDNDDVNRDDEEKFGDLSRPLGDQFTHPSHLEYSAEWGVG